MLHWGCSEEAPWVGLFFSGVLVLGFLVGCGQEGASSVRSIRAEVLAFLEAGRPDEALVGYAKLVAAKNEEEPEPLRRIGLAFLKEGLRSRVGSFRARSAKSLFVFQGDGAVPLVEEALANPDPSVRALAIEAVARSRARSALLSLLKLLLEDIPPVRASAAEALGRIQDPIALPALKGALQDREGLVTGNQEGLAW